MLLCYTGASRFSGDTIARVMQAYERGDPTVSRALDGLRRVADDMAAALAPPTPPGWAAAHRELAPPAGARSRHVHAGDGQLEQAMREAGVARRQGGRLGRGRVHVLPRAR